jgi:hypothetical protein
VQRYVTQGARAIVDAQELPVRLRERVERMAALSQWRAWDDEGRLRFVIGSLVREARLGPQETALKVQFLDNAGAQIACAVWLRRRTGQWILYRILDAQDNEMRDPQGSGGSDASCHPGT